jgi:N-acetylneuraminate lyase
MLRLRGILPAMFTLYDSRGEVTDKGLDEIISFFVRTGCTGVFVGGSTGEGLLQTVEERKKFLEAVVKTVSGRLTVIAHVGALATRDACELARFSQKVGADAVGSVMPVYYPVGAEGAVAYYRAIGESSDLPLLVYYLAAAGSGPFDVRLFVERIATLPKVFALKYTSAELETFGQIVEMAGDRVNMVMGCDQMLLPALTLGAHAAIGTTYNFMPELAVGTYDAWQRGDTRTACALMNRMFRVIHLFRRKYPPLEACREITRLRGFDTGHSREPIPRMTDAQRKELRKDLEAMGFFADPIR